MRKNDKNNFKRYFRNFKTRISQTARKVAMVGSLILAMMFGIYIPVYATSGVSTLNNYLLDIFGAFGVTVIIFGGFQFGKAMTERDSASKITALEIVIGGVVMVGIRAFVGMFGG